MGILIDRVREVSSAVIEQEADHMRNLVKNILEFSHPGEIQKSAVNIHDEIENPIGLIEYRLRTRKVKVNRAFGQEISPIMPTPRSSGRSL